MAGYHSLRAADCDALAPEPAPEGTDDASAGQEGAAEDDAAEREAELEAIGQRYLHALDQQARAQGRPPLPRRLSGAETVGQEGAAVGGGLEMTLHCDVRFAAEDARLGQPEIAIGFIPPVGATQALARLIGRPRAIRYLYDGQMIPARQALDWGLLDELVPRERLRAHVQAYAEGLAAKPAAALYAIRNAITEGGPLPFRRGLEIEREHAVKLAGTPDFIEGVNAFLEKRKPRFEA
jgi:1,4-dihydroxy-2-naphthoyl-CoA synthase